MKFKYSGKSVDSFEQLKKAAEEGNIDDCLNIVNQWRTALVSSVSDGDKTIHMLGNLQDALDKFDTLEVDAVIEKMAKNSFLYSGINKTYFQQLQEAAKTGILICTLKLPGTGAKRLLIFIKMLI